MRQQDGRRVGEHPPATSAVQRQAAGSPGKQTLVEQAYAHRGVQMSPAAASGPRAEPGGAAGAHGEEARAPGASRLVKARPKQKPDGGIISDPEDHDVASATPLPHAAPVQGEGGIQGDADAVHATAAQGISGGASSLPHRDAIQASFGHHDVSGIQAHTDSNAAAGSRALGAEAYATGSHVAFGSSAPTLHTAAHEAAHVIQQRAGVQLKAGVGEAGDAHEQHADAVADRVVQGKSAVDLLDQYAGGSGSEGVQHQAIQKMTAGGGGGGGAPRAEAASKVHSYEVELKAWIPFAKVVDPEEPVRASDWLDTISSVASAIADALEGPITAKLKYEYHSYYRGDGHVGYAGGYRVLSKASFDYDGHKITNFKHVGAYGTSHRDYNYRAWLELSAGIGPFRKTLASKTVASGSHTQTGTATHATSGSATSANQFSLGMSSANPLVMTWAPTIDSDMTGKLDPSGDMAIHFDTDLFPSHGIQVTRDGAVIKTQVVNDPSGINPLGPIGAIDIGRRLVSHSNHGTTSAP